jgi:hypothetical protein
MADIHAKVMQTAGDEHDPVSETGFGVAEALFHDVHPLHSRQDMFHRHPDLAHKVIMLALGICPFLTWLLLDRLIDHDGLGGKARESTILIQFALRRKVEFRAFCQGFVMHRSWCGRTQESHLPLTEVNDDHIFMRVRFFLPL